MTLQPVDVNHYEEIKQMLDGAPNICDFSAGTLFMWKDYYGFQYAKDSEGLIIYSAKDNSFFPCWKQPVSQQIAKLRLYAPDAPLRFSPVPEQLLHNYLPYGQATELLGWADYLYDAQALKALAGKKYHAKRNHIAKFDSLYKCEFTPVTMQDIEPLKEFLLKMPTHDNALAQYEINATIYALDNFSLLNLLSGVMRVDGQIIGLSLGEQCGDTLIIHTERCDRLYEGAHEKLAHLFMTQYGTDCVYANREEDLNVPGLRQAKESWQPIKLLKKYSVVIE